MKSLIRSSIRVTASLLACATLLFTPAALAQQPSVEADDNPVFRPRDARDRVAVYNDIHIKKDERVRDLVVVGGDAIVDGIVEGDVVVVLGSLKLTGQVDGDMVVVCGSSDLNGKVGGDSINVLTSPVLGPLAQIGRDLVVVAGKLSDDAAAIVTGERHVFVGWSFKGLVDWLAKGLLLARPLPPGVFWAWAVAGFFAFVYIVMQLLFAKPVQFCVDTLRESPVATFFVGALTFIMFLPVMILLLVTIIGSILMIIAFIASLFFGKVTVYRYVGDRLGSSLKLTSPLVALLLGILLFYVFYMVPVIGLFAWLVATVWGVGAVVMASFRAIRPAPGTPAPVVIVPTMALAGGPSTTFQGEAVPGSGATAGIETPPTVPSGSLTLERAGFWVRFGATALDVILVSVASVILGGGVSFPILLLAYHVGMWTWRSTTLGGIVVGLKVIRLDGHPMNFAVSLVRALASFFSAIALFLGFFWVAWDPERQSWHDKIAGTVIVKVPRNVSLI